MKKYMAGYFDPRTMYHPESILKWERGEYFPPVVAEISPTGKCNQKCRYCYNWKRTVHEHMDNDLLLRLPTELKQAGVKAILYQGDGEPLMHNKLAEVINSTDLSQTISTNGVLFTPAFQDKTLDKLKYMRFSVIDSSAERYAYQHDASEKQHAALVRNIEYAVKVRTKTMLMATVYLEPYSFKHAYEIISFWKDIGLDYMLVMEASYCDFSPEGKRDFTSAHYTEKQIDKMKENVSKLNDDDFVVRTIFPLNSLETGTNAETFRPGYCQGIKFETVITPVGDVIPCWQGWGRPELSFGNLHEQSFEEIWKSERRQEITNRILNTPPKGDECKACNQYKNNSILNEYKERTEWANFLL